MKTNNLSLKKGYKKTETVVKSEIDQISQRLTNRIKELAERYETPLPEIDVKLREVETKVNNHLHKMGFKL